MFGGTIILLHSYPQDTTLADTDVWQECLKSRYSGAIYMVNSLDSLMYTVDTERRFKKDIFMDWQLYLGWQGEWWTRDDIHGILEYTESLMIPVIGDPQHIQIHWIPDNWFTMNENLVPIMKDSESLLEWLEAQC